MIYGITLIILSLLAVPSLLLSKRPDAKEVLDKIAPYQGWIGVVFCLWGLFGVIVLIFNLGMLTSNPLNWVVGMATSAITALLGFILGYGLINTYVLSKNEESREKGAQLHAKLMGIQEKLGLAGLFIGCFSVAFHIFA